MNHHSFGHSVERQSAARAAREDYDGCMACMVAKFLALMAQQRVTKGA